MEETVPKIFQDTATAYPEFAAQLYRDNKGSFQSVTYRALYEEARNFACGLLSLGVKREEKIGIIADNRREWLVSDLAILSIGAVDVPRGCDSTSQEITYILKLTDCKTTLVENEKQLESMLQIAADLPALKHIVVIDSDFIPTKDQTMTGSIEVISYPELIKKGIKFVEQNPYCFEKEISKGKAEDIATIIFTSGTTGQPKGVMISHRSLVHQIRNVPVLVSSQPGEICISVLPIWHAFERIMEYLAIGMACTTAYSKPIAKIMLADLAELKPHWMASVPRLWEGIRDGIYRKVASQNALKRKLFQLAVGICNSHSVLRSLWSGCLSRFHKHSRVLDRCLAIVPLLLLSPLRLLTQRLIFAEIKKKLGGRFIAGFSAGSSLPPSVCHFFSAVGILLLQAYGLTESGPLLTLQHRFKPVRGTVGPPIPDTKIRIIDEDRSDVAFGKKGLILAKGPQIMSGYYEDPENTSKALLPDGWLNTGDLGMLTRGGDLIITGRAKDTIVLRSGENVEPAPIEGALRTSPYIQQSVVLGQDEKYLAALIVPEVERLSDFAAKAEIECTETNGLFHKPEIIELIRREIQNLICAKNGFKAFERVYHFTILPNPFLVDRELSKKQEVKRHAVNNLYRKEIEQLFQKGA